MAPPSYDEVRLAGIVGNGGQSWTRDSVFKMPGAQGLPATATQSPVLAPVVDILYHPRRPGLTAYFQWISHLGNKTSTASP